MSATKTSLPVRTDREAIAAASSALYNALEAFVSRLPESSEEASELTYEHLAEASLVLSSLDIELAQLQDVRKELKERILELQMAFLEQELARAC
jgi:hypothetical protein